MFICAGICGSAGKLVQRYHRCLQDIGKVIFTVCLFLADTPTIFAENKEDHGKQQTESLRMADRCDQKARVHNIDGHQRPLGEECAE